MDLKARITTAVDAADAVAAPFTATHAQVAQQLQLVVEDLLALPRAEQEAAFRACGQIAGTWAAHVLAECKSAWKMEEAVESIPPRRWRS